MPLSLQHRYPTLTVTVEPASEPVTVDEFLAFCMYEGTDTASRETARGLLMAARKYVERTADIACITQTRVAKFDEFPCDAQELHVVPVQSVTSIQYVATDGTLTTLDTGLYQLDADNIPPRVAPTQGNCWPCVKWDTFQAVRLTFVCGYGSDVDAVPEDVKLAIKTTARAMSQWKQCGDDMVAGALVQNLSWRPGI